MKRMKSLNGYAIYEAATRDVDKYGYEAGCFYVFFASDIRDYGIANSYPEFEGLGSLEAAEACCSGNYARAREIVEAQTTAASYEEIEQVEQLLDAGLIDEDGEIIEADPVNEYREPSDLPPVVASTTRETAAAKRKASVTLRNDSEPARIDWDAVPDSVMRMLAAALLDDYKARKEREAAQKGGVLWN